MDLTTVITIAVIVVLVLVFAFVPEARAMLKGFTRLFVKDMAQTPEGAAAIYGEAIDILQEKYNKAEDILRMAAGELATEEKRLTTLQNKLKTVESECEAFVKAGRIEMAEIKAEEREELVTDIEQSKKSIHDDTISKTNAEEAYKILDKKLRDTKRKSKEVVKNMKTKAQLKESYDYANDLKNVSAVDKLLDSVKEKNEELNTSVEGARAVYNSRTSTKVQKANEQAKKLASDDYLNSLKKKYNK